MSNVGTPPDPDSIQDESFETWEYSDIEASIHVALRAKTERYIAGHYKLHKHATQALNLLLAFCYYHRKNTGSIARVVNWSGAKYNWKKQVYGGIASCLEEGVMGWCKSGRGRALYITPKGWEIIRSYNEHPKVIHEDLLIRKAPVAA